ncbi:unnamed protein product [Thlaspi arvense]|uniref:histidine kinase n=1 Tax=Thlaspi arvense TaxID=13288 RepID=A0AAU9RSN8_THLAR|nr:unnamed protein product [Thlaspi arvense]
MSDFVNSWGRNHSPRGRRTFHRDVEQEEFQYASSHCLSSYYSVFVVRLAIMVMLAILIGMLTLLTIHFTRAYTTKSLENLAYVLRYELLQRPILRMWNLLNSTVEITTTQVKLSEYVIKRYSKAVNQAQQVELYEVMKDVTWALFASRTALNAITINYRNGFVQAFHRDHRNNNTFYIYSDLLNYSINSYHDINTVSSHQGWSDQAVHSNISAVWYKEPLDPITGQKIGKPTPIRPDDLINVPGLSEVRDGVASWNVAVSKYTDSPLLSAALPVWDAYNENIVAVVGVKTALYSVGRLMKELVEFHSGHIYLTSQEGWLLATSSNTPLLMNSTTGPKLMMAIDSEDRVIRLGAEWLKRTYEDKFPPSHEVGVTIIPRKYIMGKVDERALKTLIILISMSLSILVVGCVCIFILTSGVSKEMKLRAELISHLDARRRAEASSNYKSQFLANMRFRYSFHTLSLLTNSHDSHELRTPMAAVIGLLDILMCDDCLTNELYATITQIRKCSTALLQLLNNILDLSKVESGKLVLEETEFDLGRELEGLVDMFSVQRINHNVETVLDLSDDMPRLVQGDSARIVQIFANLISNSIKFTTSGYIVLRGWCETPYASGNTRKSSSNPIDSWCTHKTNMKQHINQAKRSLKKENKMILWFEVDDTGCGIDPSKWESVFESFEQADASTTRTHGGTGLGLSIVRTLVNKMGGEIKVVKKDGPGTLMQLFLLLSTPSHATGQHCELKLTEHGLMVLLALSGRMSRLTMSHWLQKNGVLTLGASDWNELTQNLHNLFQSKCSKHEALSTQKVDDSVFIIVVDIGMLDHGTNRWREQLNFLDKYYGRAKFAWILNHDTSNAIKMVLRNKGHVLMVNRPLYKAKMIQILDATIKEKKLEKHKITNTEKAVINETDCQYEVPSSDNSDRSEVDTIYPSESHSRDNLCSVKVLNEQKSLKGIRILLAEDTSVLQRVATIMLEKLGASVVAVGDGIQALDALNITPNTNGYKRRSSLEDGKTGTQTQRGDCLPFDLILMDCQVRY